MSKPIELKRDSSDQFTLSKRPLPLDFQADFNNDSKNNLNVFQFVEGD